MPAAQLVGASIETALNKLLRLDAQSAERLKPLDGKSLTVDLREFNWPLTFVFSEKVDLLVSKGSEQSKVDCHIQTSISALQQLQDSSQISSLIQQNKLQLDGDIHVAQNFANLLKQLNIDWEEQLSKYIGDVAAHSVFQFGKTLTEQISTQLDHVKTMLSDGTIEEKPVAAHKHAVTDFCQQVSELRSDTDRLAARLQKLEQLSG